MLKKRANTKNQAVELNGAAVEDGRELRGAEAESGINVPPPTQVDDHESDDGVEAIVGEVSASGSLNVPLLFLVEQLFSD